jgi:hypothetical protein
MNKSPKYGFLRENTGFHYGKRWVKYGKRWVYYAKRWVQQKTFFFAKLRKNTGSNTAKYGVFSGRGENHGFFHFSIFLRNQHSKSKRW